MDPTANLNEQREMTKRMILTTGPEDFETCAVRLMDLVLALDAWLTSGGFLPEDWA